MRKAVVLFNFGGPSGLQKVAPFLYELFSDPAVLPYPSWVRKPLAHLFSRIRTPKAIEVYRQLGGKSPLLENTENQSQALSHVLGPTYKVFVAMRYGDQMTIAQAVAEVQKFQPHEIILLPLYPQFSTTTTGSAFREWSDQTRQQKLCKPEYRICCYPEMEGWIAAFSELIWKDIQKNHSQPPRILFSAHGLPHYLIRQGDPYCSQVMQTQKKVLKALFDLSRNKFESVLCYQSRVGKIKWTGPSLEEELIRASQDKRGVCVVPVSFVSEHSETLIELDKEYQKLADSLGIKNYSRVSTVGCHTRFIEGIAHLIRQQRCRIACSAGWKRCWRR